MEGGTRVLSGLVDMAQLIACSVTGGFLAQTRRDVMICHKQRSEERLHNRDGCETKNSRLWPATWSEGRA